MKLTHTLTLFTVLTVGAHAATTIVGTDTQNLSSYSDGNITLTPYASTDPLLVGTLNSGPNFIGVDGGTNVNAVDDADGALGGADQEALDFELGALAGLTEIVFQFTRADGPLGTDGVQITGFASDPGATGTPGFADVRWDAGTNSVYAEIAGAQFNNAHTLSFANLAASTGQTLRMTVADSDEAAPQAALASITYDVVPEPSSTALLGLGGLALMLRRRR